MQTNSVKFYSDLILQTEEICNIVADRSKFVNVPDDWHVVVADIKDSTQAISQGNHNEVNLVATGSIIAVLNSTEDINVPFFFGGDGATFIVPSQYLTKAMSALNKHRLNTLKNFGFELKIGHYAVGDLYLQKIPLVIAKVKISKALNIPVVLGNALQFVESTVKANNNLTYEEFQNDNSPLNMEGMACKWDKIKPPNEGEEVVSLIVTGCGEQDPAQVFSEVLKGIDDIYGSPNRRKPISVKRLKLKAGIRQINAEMRTKLGRYDLLYIIKNLFKTTFGQYYLNYSKQGKQYLKQLVQLSDTLSIDGRINTVISGTPEQRITLTKYLQNLEDAKKLKFGLYVSQESVMSCYVRDMKTDQHIHFVDGSNGGYTQAANMLKEK